MSVSSTAGNLSGPALRRLPGFGRRVLKTLFATAVTLTAMAGVAAFLLDPPEFATQSPERPAAPRAEWIEIVRPFQLYAMPSQAFGAEPRQFSARRHQTNGDRVDSLSFGAEEPGKGNWLRIEIRRYGEVQEPAVALFPDMARLAARAGAAVSRSALPGQVETRFGKVEMADLQVQTGEKFTACIGFRLPRQAPGIGFSGIGCGTADRPVDRNALVCAINRLDLLSSGDDRDLGKYFAATETQRRRDCAQVRNAAAPGKQPEWLSTAAPGLPLKGTLAQAENRRR